MDCLLVALDIPLRESLILYCGDWDSCTIHKISCISIMDRITIMIEYTAELPLKTKQEIAKGDCPINLRG